MAQLNKVRVRCTHNARSGDTNEVRFAVDNNVDVKDTPMRPNGTMSFAMTNEEAAKFKVDDYYTVSLAGTAASDANS